MGRSELLEPPVAVHVVGIATGDQDVEGLALSIALGTLPEHARNQLTKLGSGV
jgi:hypothetical protein